MKPEAIVAITAVTVLETLVVSKGSNSGNQTSKAVSGDSASNQTVQDSDTGYGTDSSEPAPEIQKSEDSGYVEGYEMQKESAEEPDNRGVSFSGSDIFGILFVVAAVGGIDLRFRKKKT